MASMAFLTIRVNRAWKALLCKWLVTMPGAPPYGVADRAGLPG
jgi:hypothetical protein